MILIAEWGQAEKRCIQIMLDSIVRYPTFQRWRSKNPSLEQGRKPLRHAPCLGHGSRLRSRESRSTAVAGLRVLPHRLLSSPDRQSGAAAPYVGRAPRATGSPVPASFLLVPAASVPLRTLRREWAGARCQRLAATRKGSPLTPPLTRVFGLAGAGITIQSKAHIPQL